MACRGRRDMNKASFSFAGNNAGSAFGATNKPSGFGFGGSTSTAPAFGTGTATTGFGTGATTGAFGGFGTAAAGTGGLAFGATASTASTGGFGFGSTNTATQGTSGGFSFGNKPAATTAATGTGFSFGSTTGFGGGTTGGFGTATSSSGFGTGTSTGGFGSTTGGFGTGSTFGSGTSAFGSGTGTTGFGTGTGSAFGTGTGTGSAFGTGTGTAFGTGTGGLFGGGLKTSQPSLGFGSTLTTNNTFKGFGQPQQQQQQLQQQQSNICPSVALYLSVCAPAYFGDERDEVLKKWNQLQAVWGTGKGFYSPDLPPVEFTPDNEFCRFKAVGYIKMPSFTPEEGLVELVISKKVAVVREQQSGLVAELCKIYGGNVQVCVEYVKPGPGDDKTRLCYYVQTRNPNGETKKANTMDVYNHLKGDQNKQSVCNLCIEHATPLVALSDSQLKEYLEKPPRGIDPVIWEQGKRANPDPSKYLPVPLVGFRELQARFKAQETESGLLQGQLDKVAEDICTIQHRQAKLLDQLKESNRKQRQMAHRVMQLVVKQECSRKRGVPIDGGEEQLRLRLETLQSQLMAPTQYMGKLNELLSHMSAKGGNGYPNGGAVEPVRMRPETEADIKEFLAWQQDGISEVTSVLKNDIKTFHAMVKAVTS